jgi:hypothetical protein
VEHIITKIHKEISSLKKSSNVFSQSGDWAFFKDDVEEEWVICHLNKTQKDFLLSISSFLLKKELSPSTCNEALIDGDYSASDGWKISYDLSQTSELIPELEGRSGPLGLGEPLYFIRQFKGFKAESEDYFEINQQLSTSLGLHWVSEKNSYCSLNRLGESVPEIFMKITTDLSILIIKRSFLDRFLSVTGMVLLRCFEYRKLDIDSNSQLLAPPFEIYPEDPNFCFKKYLFGKQGSNNGFFIRGYNIVHYKKSYIQIEQEEADAENNNAPLNFIIKDIKNEGKKITTSLKRENLASYFEESNKPWGSSPVFFKSDVLNKYKQDPEKYTILERTITCRGGWRLQYDINAQGQVHAMAVHLIDLPYSELCYWFSFNAEPKGDISERSYQTDFLGKVSTELGLINKLKQALVNLTEIKIKPENEPLWRPHNNDIEETFFGFFYVTSDNHNDWQECILDLYRIVIEGFSQIIVKISERLKCRDKTLKGSINILEQCLVTLNVDNDLVEKIIPPLRDLITARNHHTKAHRGKDKAELDKFKEDEIFRLKNNLKEFKKDGMARLEAITISIITLGEICAQGKLDTQV